MTRTEYREWWREDSARYGFTWENVGVVRAISHRGYKVLDVRTDRETLQVQITPTGLIRVGNPTRVKFEEER